MVDVPKFRLEQSTGELQHFVICIGMENFDKFDDYLAETINDDISVRFVSDQEIHIYFPPEFSKDRIAHILQDFLRK